MKESGCPVSYLFLDSWSHLNRFLLVKPEPVPRVGVGLKAGFTCAGGHRDEKNCLLSWKRQREDVPILEWSGEYL